MHVSLALCSLHGRRVPTLPQSEPQSRLLARRSYTPCLSGLTTAGAVHGVSYRFRTEFGTAPFLTRHRHRELIHGVCRHSVRNDSRLSPCGRLPSNWSLLRPRQRRARYRNDSFYDSEWRPAAPAPRGDTDARDRGLDCPGAVSTQEYVESDACLTGTTGHGRMSLHSSQHSAEELNSDSHVL